MSRKFPAAFFGVIFFALSAGPLGAETLFQRMYWSFGGSIIFIMEDNGLESDPMPIAPAAGLALDYPVARFFNVEATLDIYGTYYAYSTSLGRAVPAAVENRSSFVLGPVLAVQAVLRFPISRIAELRCYGGPAADLRMCLAAGGLEAADRVDAAAERRKVASYFWSRARWFLPVAGLGVDFRVSSRLVLGLDARVWFPLYKVWTGENLPKVEGWRIGLGFRASIR